MSSKIKVDPRTFKIINQGKLVESKTESDTLTSDSESITSINSDADSVKVIKLDDSLQSGGKGKYQQQQQQQQQQQLQQQQPQQQSLQQQQPLQQRQPPQSSQEVTKNGPQLNIINSNLPSLEKQPNLSEQKSMEENYLRKNEPIIESSVSEISDNLSESSTETEKEENPPIVEQNGSTDVIDLTKSQLHDVLYSIFTDVAGDNISENILKMSKLFEAHNQIMEKILNQIVIMNSNYKQITVPEAIQTNTNKAKTLNDFRTNIKKSETTNEI